MTEQEVFNVVGRAVGRVIREGLGAIEGANAEAVKRALGESFPGKKFWVKEEGSAEVDNEFAEFTVVKIWVGEIVDGTLVGRLYMVREKGS